MQYLSGVNKSTRDSKLQPEIFTRQIKYRFTFRCKRKETALIVSRLTQRSHSD